MPFSTSKLLFVALSVAVILGLTQTASTTYDATSTMNAKAAKKLEAGESDAAETADTRTKRAAAAADPNAACPVEPYCPCDDCWFCNPAGDVFLRVSGYCKFFNGACQCLKNVTLTAVCNDAKCSDCFGSYW